MATPEHSRARPSLASWCRIAIIVLAICSLTASLATRYTGLGPEVQRVAAVKSQSLDVQRQRLLGNALQWTTPASSFTLFQPPRPSVFAVSVFVPSPSLRSESWLYNRPPPSCWLSTFAANQCFWTQTQSLKLAEAAPVDCEVQALLDRVWAQCKNPVRQSSGHRWVKLRIVRRDPVVGDSCGPV